MKSKISLLASLLLACSNFAQTNSLQLPSAGPLFPYLRTVRASDRATEFKQRCKGLGIEGVTPHSYRYSWAERARECGYPERLAQEALEHGSKAIHRAYARGVNPEQLTIGEWKNRQTAFNAIAVEFKNPASQPIEGLASAWKINRRPRY